MSALILGVLTLFILSTSILHSSEAAAVFFNLKQNGREGVLYPAEHMKRSGVQSVLKRKDFLNFLADSWQETGSLRNAIREIQDMTESKRNVMPGPRVGKRVMNKRRMARVG